jgi:hypothetical protein
MQQKPGPQIARSGGGAASVAFMLDSVLKGYMRGREQAQQKNFEKAKKLNDGLRYAYETTAQNYTSLIQSGKSPDDPEVQKADAAQRAAYQSWRQMQNNYITGGDKKKSKSKSSSSSKGGDQSGGAGGGTGEDPLQLISSKDPKEKLRGISLMQDKLFQKVGTPANAAAAPYLNPEYRKQLALNRGEQRIEGDVQKKRIDLHDLQSKDPKTLNDDDRAKLERLQSDPELFPEISRTVPHYGNTDIPGESLASAKDPAGNPLRDKFGNPIDPKMTYRAETVGGVQSYVPSVAHTTPSKPGSEQAFIEQFAKENGVDPKSMPADQQLRLRQVWSASNQTATIRNGEIMWTDNAGISWMIPTKSVTTHVAAGSTPNTGKKSAPKPPVEGAQSVSAATGGAGASGRAKPGVRDLPASGTGTGSSASTSASAETPTPPVPGAVFVGKHKLSQSESKSESVVADTYKKMKPLFGLLGAQEQYMNEVKSDPAKASPRQDLSLVVAAVRAMNPGSVRLPQKELELEMKAGSWGDQASRWYEKASTGLLPEDQRNDLFKIVQRETTKAGESIAADWQQYMGGQALPDDLKRFGKSGGGDNSTGGGNTKSTPLTPDQKKLLDEAFPPQ